MWCNKSQIHPSASSLNDLRSCKEEQMWLVVPESIIQEELLTSTNIASKTFKSDLP